MTLLLVTAVIGLLGAGVVWAGVRLLREVARFDDWDRPVIRQKRERWR